jgi:23S rRNA (cytosine1962-C5)-methyltransferase
MKKTRAIVKLTPGGKHRVLRGHPWVFDNEIAQYDGSFDPGDIVELRDGRSRFVGLGYINPASSIRVRMLSREDVDIDSELIAERIRRAVDYRSKAFGLSSKIGECNEGFRLVYSEADFLPGLVVDIFAGYISFQVLTLGMERWKDTIINTLREYVSPKGIYERNDAPVRRLEGLVERSGYVGEPFDPLVEIHENGNSVLVDVQRGQKTGYFLDQSSNRGTMGRFLDGATVLDAFSYSGGFGLAAVGAGASRVTCVDISGAALDLARASAVKNGFQSRMEFKEANVFDYLRQLESESVQYDAVILDPPAFARSRKMVPKGLVGYKEINLRAMKIIRDGGYLFTSSCSQHVTNDEFDVMLQDSAHDAKKHLRIIEKRGQRKDHPILSSVPETEYLKFRSCQVFNRF